MVRVPRSWPPPAGLAGSQRYRGLAARRIPSPSPVAYVRQVTVDLGNDGMAPQIVLQGSGTQAGILNPAEFETLLSVPVPPGGGTLTVTWSVTLAGTVGAPDAGNFQLGLQNAGLPFGGFLVSSVNTGTDGTFPQTAVTVVAPAGSGPLVLQVKGNTPTAGAVYGGSITIPGFGQAFAGPSSGGDLWSLDQCFLSTSVGQLDAAQCAVYAGPLPLAQYAVTAGLAGGSSQFGLGGVAVPFGWFIWAVWTGGTAGAAGYLRVTGQKTVLTN